MRGLVAWVLVTILTGCGGSAHRERPCGLATECDLETGGACLEAPSRTAWCAYPDSNCGTGMRWSELAGEGLGTMCRCAACGWAAAGRCGTIDDGCGQMLTCGCTPPEYCAGSECACTPGAPVDDFIDDAVRVEGASIAVDPAHGLNVLYYAADTRDLKYGYLGQGENEWARTVVDATGDVGSGASVAIGSDGVLHVSYVDATNGALKHASKAVAGVGGEWVIETVDTVGPPGGDRRTSIAVGPMGEVHIAYPSDGIKYAYLASGGEWTIFEVDGGLSESPALAVDAIGAAHLVYYNEVGHLLRYGIRPPSGAWTLSIVDSGGDVGIDPSLIVDGGGTVHVAYFDAGNQDLKYLRIGEAPITVDAPGDVGRHSAIALDGAGVLHVVYSELVFGRMRHATNGGGSWTAMDLGPPADPHASFTISPAGALRVVHFADADDTLRLRSWCD